MIISDKRPTPPFIPAQSQRMSLGGKGQFPEPTHDQIAQAAYDIYVASGWIQGQSEKNWLEAEQSLRRTEKAAHQGQEHMA